MITVGKLPRQKEINFVQPRGFKQTRCLLRVVHSEASEEIGQPPESRAGTHKFQDEIPIHGEMELYVESPDFFIVVSSPEKRLLRNIVETSHAFRVVGGHHPSADLQPVRIDDDAVTVDDVHFGMLLKVAPHVTKRSGHEAVVRILEKPLTIACACPSSGSLTV